MNKYQPGLRNRAIDDTLQRLNRGVGGEPDESFDEPVFDLRAFFGLVRRQKWTILVTIVLGLGLGILYVSQVQRQYTATALVRSDNLETAILGLNNNLPNIATQIDIATQIEFIRSEAVLMNAAGAVNLPSSPVFDARPSRLDGLLSMIGLGRGEDGGTESDRSWQSLANAERGVWARSMGRHLQVSQRGIANVIAISVTTPIPSESASWANAIAAAYLDVQVLDQLEGYQIAIDRLARQVDALDQEARAFEVDFDQVVGAINNRTTLLGQLAAETDAQRQDQIRADIQTLEQQIRDLANRTAPVLEPPLRLAGTFAEENLPEELLAGVLTLQQQTTLARTNYNTRLAQLRELQQNAGLVLPEWNIMSAAVAPTEPSYPSIRSTLAMALLLSAAAGFGLAFARENWIGGIGDVEQLSRTLGIPVLAAVPKYKGTKDVGPDWAIVNEPLSGFSESIRRLRIGIEAIAGEETLRLVVTSSVPGEGKTTLALAIARSLAYAGRSTMLIDADLRHPNVHQHSAGTTPSGLIDYLLRGQDGSHLIVTKEEGSNLTLILGSDPSPVATDGLLLSERFRQLVRYASDNFECVVFDSPPVGLVVDAHVLARSYANAILFVTKADSTGTRVAQSALREMQAHTDVPLVGVLNQTTAKSRYYGKYAGYYY